MPPGPTAYDTEASAQILLVAAQDFQSKTDLDGLYTDDSDEDDWSKQDDWSGLARAETLSYPTALSPEEAASSDAAVGARPPGCSVAIHLPPQRRDAAADLAATMAAVRDDSSYYPPVDPVAALVRASELLWRRGRGTR